MKKFDLKKALNILNLRLERFKRKKNEREVHQEALKKEVEVLEKEYALKRNKERIEKFQKK